MLWVDKVAVDRSSVNEDAGAKQVCPARQERGKTVGTILQRITGPSLAHHDCFESHVRLIARIVKLLSSVGIVEFETKNLWTTDEFLPSVV